MSTFGWEGAWSRWLTAEPSNSVTGTALGRTQRKGSKTSGKRSVPSKQHTAYRWGKDDGWCRIDGQKFPLKRPRARAAGRQRVPLGSYLPLQEDSSARAEAVAGSVARAFDTELRADGAPFRRGLQDREIGRKRAFHGGQPEETALALILASRDVVLAEAATGRVEFSAAADGLKAELKLPRETKTKELRVQVSGRR